MKAAIRLGPDYLATWRFTRIPTSRRLRVYSISLRNWYWNIPKKLWMWIRLRVHLPHGRNLRCLVIKRSSGQKQKYVFSQTLNFVWGRCGLKKMGRPSGRRTGSSSCQCSTTSIGQRKEMMRFVCRMQKKVKDYALRFLQGHWTFLGPGKERKWYGESSYPPNGESDSTAIKKGTAIQRNWPSRFEKHQCFESLNPEEEEGCRNHTLQWRFIEHRTLVPNYSFCKSAQYLRSRDELVWTTRFDRGRKKDEKSWDLWTKFYLTSVKSHEVQLLVSLPTLASGNSLQENILSFEALSDKIQFSSLCDYAWLEHRVSAGMTF